jgi:hypothetical protein
MAMAISLRYGKASGGSIPAAITAEHANECVGSDCISGSVTFRKPPSAINAFALI